MFPTSCTPKHLEILCLIGAMREMTLKSQSAKEGKKKESSDLEYMTA
jgi:hypothetical protein